MGLLTQSEQQYYNSNNFGDYQFVSLDNIIANFMATYVGEEKILPRTKRGDVSFHAHRALQELSYDTLKSCKTQEIEVPTSLTMILPQDYVNYVKLTWSDASGIEHIIYPTSKTSNPSNPVQNTDGDFALQAVGTMTDGSHVIVLDAEYKNIILGMGVSGPNIPFGSIVYATYNSGGITTIEISTTSFIFANATYTGTETLTFIPQDDSLVLSEESSYILENITYVAGEDKLTQSPNTDVSNIKVGMLVSHVAFQVGTTVIDVNGAVITTSNPSSTSINPAGFPEVTFISPDTTSDTWSNYKSATPSENQDDYQDDTYWPLDGSRFGLDPQHAQANGSFYIDCNTGKIHFSSNLSGKTVTLKYISDGLSGSSGFGVGNSFPSTTFGDVNRTSTDILVHKFAEEAVYKWIIYGCISARIDIPEYVVKRFKKERFAETRKAKLRLSNIKLEEITQVLRGKSKQIKH